MSENIKLVIEIPKDEYEFIKKYGSPVVTGYASILDGKPLSEVLDKRVWIPYKAESEDI